MSRTHVVRISRRLHAMGWVANHDGNVSLRVGRDRFLITPTATSKADVTESSLVLIDGAGKVVEGRMKPPGETELHLAAYRARPDVNAVVHAHPPFATAFGAVPLLPFALPKTPQVTEAVTRGATEAEAMLMPGNGVLTLGPDTELAYLRMELVEHLAKILHAARALGGSQPLPDAAMTELRQAHRKTFPRK
jgi:L-fuculose-phosphate aldolase